MKKLSALVLILGVFAIVMTGCSKPEAKEMEGSWWIDQQENPEEGTYVKEYITFNYEKDNQGTFTINLEIKENYGNRQYNSVLVTGNVQGKYRVEDGNGSDKNFCPEIDYSTVALDVTSLGAIPINDQDMASLKANCKKAFIQGLEALFPKDAKFCISNIYRNPDNAAEGTIVLHTGESASDIIAFEAKP